MHEQVVISSDGRVPIPCLRWAGGKRRQLKYLEPLVPAQFNRYFEPMLGGGALFLRLQPKQAVLGDSNAELIDFYRVLRHNTEELISRLAELRPSEKAFYEVRDMQPTCPIDKAARFAFLNRLAWNGIYRVNKQGKFNVPFGKRTPKTMWDTDNLRAIAGLLRSASLFTGDFEKCVASVDEGDFVFLDPPYPRGAKNGMGFNRYTSEFFLYQDHERMACCASTLASKGAFVLVMESAHPEIARLYTEEFTRLTIKGKALIAGKASARRTVAELVLHNYDVE